MTSDDAYVLAQVVSSVVRQSADAIGIATRTESVVVQEALVTLSKAGLYAPDGCSIPHVLEFIRHALRYVCPPELGVRDALGVPTAASLPAFEEYLVPAVMPLVWPATSGSELVVGRALLRLHPSAPAAVQDNPRLHLVLACADCFRVGQARERELAHSFLASIMEEHARGYRAGA